MCETSPNPSPFTLHNLSFKSLYSRAVRRGADVRGVLLWDQGWRNRPRETDPRALHHNLDPHHLPDLPRRFVGQTARAHLVCAYRSLTHTHTTPPYPSVLAGTLANNSQFESYAGCSTRFNVSIGQNDTSSAYKVSISPSVHTYRLYNGTLLQRPGLPQGASFEAVDATQRSFVFEWEHELGYEGQWLVCFDLQDNVDINNLRRCVQVLVHRCRRCVKPGDSLHSIARMYGAHWLEIFAVNPLLRGDPDGLIPGTVWKPCIHHYLYRHLASSRPRACCGGFDIACIVPHR